jgi:predicted unusual protein kinase regulating ubiquinone biosynthesis (AarF/ABC1/UbiB family)
VEVTDISRFAEVMKTIAAPSTPSTVFRPEIFMIFRSFTLLEGLCKSLDPDFVILDAVAPLTTAFASDPSVYRMKIEDDLRVFMKSLF